MTGKSQQTIGLADYLEASARRFPQRPAVVDPDGSVRTYRELDEQSSHLAAFLRSRGIAQGDRVALLMPKSADGVTAIFGILKAGAAYVPVDCTAPSPRVHSILKDCRVRALFTNLNGLKILQEGPAEAVPETVVVVRATVQVDLCGERHFIDPWLIYRMFPVGPRRRGDSIQFEVHYETQLIHCGIWIGTAVALLVAPR